MRPFALGEGPTPRGYHSVAILLPDGSVPLIGGRDDPVFFPGANSQDSIDHFQPPYFFKGQRPVIWQAPPTIQYAQPFTVKVLLQALPPPGGPVSPLARFCLMGIGSVTHHFDYGQRYVELLYEKVTNSKFRVLAPPKKCMAPDGYYLLFAVDELGRPSIGQFVQLTF